MTCFFCARITMMDIKVITDVYNSSSFFITEINMTLNGST